MSILPNLGEKGKVVVVVDSATLFAEANGPQYLVDRAISEIALQKRYTEDELEFIKSDEVLKESARRNFLAVRKRVHAVPEDQYSAQKKGREFIAPPTQYRITLHFRRPATRGMFDREV